MIANLFDSTTIPVLQEVVNFSQARHTVLAGNIANMDTPGYKVRDLSVEDFQSRLQQAIETRHEPPSSSEGHHDQNNVGIEHQVTEMVKNQMQHNMALSIMVQQFHLLETAISEKV
jgi:flagellar basal-body rod protein FlgB